MHGILLLDKPAGITSNKVVTIVKNRVKPSKVGHTGTLDPAATGLMVILIGQATRSLDYLDERRKAYSLTVVLGEETDTDDREGQIVSTADASGINRQDVEGVLVGYRGVIDQVPPHFAAIKQNGVPLYKLARKGVFPDLKPRKVEIFLLELTGWDPPIVNLDLVCSKGTYARALARDIGRDLGVGGRLENLRRTASGPFTVEQAFPLDDVSQGGPEFIRTHLMNLSSALEHIPDLEATPSHVKRLMRGNPVVYPRNHLCLQVNDRPVRLFKISSGDGGVLILVRPEPRGGDIALRPVRVFNMWDDLA